MAEYTEILFNKAIDIDIDDVDFDEESLIKIMTEFRSFDEAITTFICEHGYVGDKEDINAKIGFIKDAFKIAEIDYPRNLTKWFTEKKGIEKIPTGYQICFAFNLGVDEANDFLTQKALVGSIDCHVKEEAVFYYFLKHNLKFADAEKLLNSLNNESAGSDERIYTQAIRNRLDEIGTVDELKKYMESNSDIFTYHLVTATKYVQNLWNKISSSGGLVNWEESQLFDDDAEDRKILSERKLEPSKRKSDQLKKSINKKKSTEVVIHYILGLNEGLMLPTRKYNERFGRILKNNEIICRAAADNFPDRLGIENILNCIPVKQDKIRKNLILLSFYEYWCTKLKEINRGNYLAYGDDSEGCIAYINNYLIGAGLSPLYAGNPYDWIFFFSIYSEEPLWALRGYMQIVEERYMEF